MTLENEQDKFTSTVLTQISEKQILRHLLTKPGWTNHLELISKTANTEERVWYVALAIKEKYSIADLTRQIESSLYERQFHSKQKLKIDEHPVQIDSDVERKFVENRIKEQDDLNNIVCCFKFTNTFEVNIPKIIGITSQTGQNPFRRKREADIETGQRN